MQKSGNFKNHPVSFIVNSWNGNNTSWQIFCFAWVIGLAFIIGSIMVTGTLAKLSFASGLAGYSFSLIAIATHTLFICVSAWRAFHSSYSMFWDIVPKILIIFYAIFVLRIVMFIPPPGIVPGT